MKFKFSQQIFETNSNTNVIKIRPVGAELFHAGGRTDRRNNRRTNMTKFIVGFRNFVNAPKILIMDVSCFKQH